MTFRTDYTNQSFANLIVNYKSTKS